MALLGYYMRVTIALWNVNTYSEDAERAIRIISSDGLRVFRAQSGFINYRLMRANNTRTVAVTKWKSEELALRLPKSYREWKRNAGILDLIKFETYAGEIVVDSDVNKQKQH